MGGGVNPFQNPDGQPSDPRIDLSGGKNLVGDVFHALQWNWWLDEHGYRCWYRSGNTNSAFRTCVAKLKAELAAAGRAPPKIWKKGMAAPTEGLCKPPVGAQTPPTNTVGSEAVIWKRPAAQAKHTRCAFIDAEAEASGSEGDDDESEEEGTRPSWITDSSGMSGMRCCAS